MVLDEPTASTSFKHSEAALAEGVKSDLRTIGWAYGTVDCAIVLSKLEAAGILTVPVCRQTASVAWHLTTAFGGVEIRVPQSQAMAAREIISDCEPQTIRKRGLLRSVVFVLICLVVQMPPPAAGFFAARVTVNREHAVD